MSSAGNPDPGDLQVGFVQTEFKNTNGKYFGMSQMCVFCPQAHVDKLAKEQSYRSDIDEDILKMLARVNNKDAPPLPHPAASDVGDLSSG